MVNVVVFIAFLFIRLHKPNEAFVKSIRGHELKFINWNLFPFCRVARLSAFQWKIINYTSVSDVEESRNGKFSLN